MLAQRLLTAIGAKKTAAAATSSAALMVTIWTISNIRSQATIMEEEHGKSEEESPSFQMEVNFLDKLANKAYIHDTENGHFPNTLRLLTIDIPNIATKGFTNGTCKLATNRIYPDGIAVSNKVAKIGTVEQKALVQSMFRCFHEGKVGVEILQASVRNLNRHHLTRDHPVRRFRNQLLSQEEEEEGDDADLWNTNSEHYGNGTSAAARGRQQILLELEAPWNQHAWISELELRVAGYVDFGASLDRAPHRQWWWSWLLWLGRRRSDYYYQPLTKKQPEQQPHAVIAHGEALAQVPGSLRILQKICQEHQVPLYIYKDPRRQHNSPPNNTNDNLGDILRDVRSHVKERIILAQGQDDRSFERGRKLGRFEQNLQWTARQTKQMATNAVREVGEARRQRQERNWSRLEQEELRKKLVQHKVLGKDSVGTSEAMKAIARSIVETSDNDGRNGKETPADSEL